MKNALTHPLLILVAALGLLVSACSDDASSGPGDTQTDSDGDLANDQGDADAVPDTQTDPDAVADADAVEDVSDVTDVTDEEVGPTISTVDRMGRPGINTVLILTGRKDAYNQADRADWSTFVAEITSLLDVIDGLDSTLGNALLGDSATLAVVIADDRLVMNTAIPDCDAYLAVELGSTTDCGGRTLERDVIDDTLSALVGVPVSDGVANDSLFFANFPFLAPANGNTIDRMGRPGVNTALIPSEWKDAYNQAESRNDWPGLFAGLIQASLDFVDNLDGEFGDALLGDSATLAFVIADDRLVINTAIANCDAYLAVELGSTTDCGGRTLERDVMDDTLSALVGAAVSDGVANDSTFDANFPFLAAPNVE